MKKAFNAIVAAVLVLTGLPGLSFAAPIVRPTITGDLIGKYKARIYVYDTGMPIFLDLSARKRDYERGDVYENGSIVRYVEVWRSDFSEPGNTNDPRRMESALDLYVLKGTDYVGTLNCTLEYTPVLDTWKIVKTTFRPAPDVGIFTRGDDRSSRKTEPKEELIMYRKK